MSCTHCNSECRVRTVTVSVVYALTVRVKKGTKSSQVPHLIESNSSTTVLMTKSRKMKTAFPFQKILAIIVSQQAIFSLNELWCHISQIYFSWFQLNVFYRDFHGWLVSRDILYNNGIAMHVSTFLSFFVCLRTPLQMVGSAYSRERL